MKNLYVLIALTLIAVAGSGCSKNQSDDTAAIAAKDRFDAAYNHDKIMQTFSPEEEKKLLKKFD